MIIEEICKLIMQYPYPGIPRVEKHRLCAWLEENASSTKSENEEKKNYG